MCKFGILQFLQFPGLIQAIDAFRSKLQPVLSEALSESETAFPREWLQQGRQTPPRLMVYFGTPPKGRQAQGMNLVGWTLDLDLWFFLDFGGLIHLATHLLPRQDG